MSYYTDDANSEYSESAHKMVELMQIRGSPGSCVLCQATCCGRHASLRVGYLIRLRIGVSQGNLNGRLQVSLMVHEWRCMADINDLGELVLSENALLLISVE